MATAYFVDSSALVKRYVRETGTAWVRGITYEWAAMFKAWVLQPSC